MEGSAQGADGVAEERRTSPVELLWDLVFVFAITQVTTLLANHLNWTGFWESMLVLALSLVGVVGVRLGRKRRGRRIRRPFV